MAGPPGSAPGCPGSAGKPLKGLSPTQRFLHASPAAWAGMAQRLGSDGTVNLSACPWLLFLAGASSQRGRFRESLFLLDGQSPKSLVPNQGGSCMALRDLTSHVPQHRFCWAPLSVKGVTGPPDSRGGTWVAPLIGRVLKNLPPRFKTTINVGHLSMRTAVHVVWARKCQLPLSVSFVGFSICLSGTDI